MPKPIIWSPLSEHDFASILEYLEKEWEDKVVIQFIEITDAFLEQISINPTQFPVINKTEKVRKCVITKHNTLFYRNSKELIELLRRYSVNSNAHSLLEQPIIYIKAI